MKRDTAFRYARNGPERAGLSALYGGHRAQHRAWQNLQLTQHTNFQQTSQGLYALQQGLQQASQLPALAHHPNAGLHTLSHQAAVQGVQQALQHPAQKHALLHSAAGSLLMPNTFTAAQHASSSLPPWWSYPFASASAAAVAAAGSDVNPAAHYTRALTGTAGAAGSSATPAGSSANLPALLSNPPAPPADPDVLVPTPYGLQRYDAVRMPDRTAEKPRKRPGSASSTQGQATGPVDLDAARSNARSHKRSACDRHGSPSALNRPVARPLTAAIAPAADATADKCGDAHPQIVKHLLRSRNCSKADRASDLCPSSFISAHAAPEAAGDDNVPAAAAVTAAAKAGNTESLLPTTSAPPKPLPSSRLKQQSPRGTRRPISGRTAALKAQAAVVAKLKADTKQNAAAAVAAAAAVLVSMPPAVTEPQQHGPSNAPLQPVSYPQISSATGVPQDNALGSEAGVQNRPQDNRSGSLGPTQPGVPGGSAAAMPPPAPRQPTEAAAGTADLLWSRSCHSRDMHSLGAGLLHLPDPGDRPRWLRRLGGSQSMQSTGEQETPLHSGHNDCGDNGSGHNDSVVRLSSLPGKTFCQCW